jgi:hypothetical protein
MLELMARGGMRIGEVLKLRLKELQDRKLIQQKPKSGREHEMVFIPQKVANRLREYALEVCMRLDDRIFPISYEGARVIVAKTGPATTGLATTPDPAHTPAAGLETHETAPLPIEWSSQWSAATRCAKKDFPRWWANRSRLKRPMVVKSEFRQMIKNLDLYPHLKENCLRYRSMLEPPGVSFRRIKSFRMLSNAALCAKVAMQFS